MISYVGQTNEGNKFFVGFFINRFGHISEQPLICPVLWITTKELNPVNFSVFTVTGHLESNVAIPGQLTYIHVPVEYIVSASTEDPEF